MRGRGVVEQPNITCTVGSPGGELVVVESWRCSVERTADACGMISARTGHGSGLG